MVKFEAERDREKKEKEDLKLIARKQKNREMAQKFQQAENIRAEERQLKQARFFHQQLKQMIKDENKEARMSQITS